MIALLVACSKPPDGAGPPTDTPELLPFDNVLMLSIDTLRRDHVDRYATDGLQRMPFLSSLLDDGLALDHHRQCSNWTFHSMTCTTLGRPVEEVGWTARMGLPAAAMPYGMTTLASRLTDAGFYTAVRSTNGWFSDEWNAVQGYGELLQGAPGGMGVQIEVSLEQVAEDLAADPGKRWFLHVHGTEPHAPYVPPESYLGALADLPPIPWDLSDGVEHYVAVDTWPTLPPDEQALLEQHLHARYDGELAWVDDQLRDVWAQLDAGGWLENTLVVLWTDHGEQFWEHGHATHAWTLGPEEVDGILGFWGHGLAPRGITTPTHGVDLVPTVLSFLGLPVPDDGSLPGFVAGTAPADRPLYANSVARTGAVTSVVDGGLELVFDFDSGLDLYDVTVDPGRTTDIVDLAPPELAGLWSLLEPKVWLLSAAAPDLTVEWPELPTADGAAAR